MSTLLFVPGTDREKMEKSRSLNCRGIILDLEDGVADTEKERARCTVANWLQEGPPSPARMRYVRINSLKTSQWVRDLEAVVPAGSDGLVVPKIEDVESLELLDDALTRLERQCGRPPGQIGLLVLIETAAGIVRMEHLLSSCSRILAAGLGLADLCADVGMSLESVFQEANLFSAERVRLVLISKALGLQAPWDSVYVRLNDEEGLRRDALFGRQIGCQGKMVIHPNQLHVVERVYGVSDAEVQRARHVLEVFEQARLEGRGAAVTDDGYLVDAPVVQWAEDILRRRNAPLVER